MNDRNKTTQGKPSRAGGCGRALASGTWLGRVRRGARGTPVQGRLRRSSEASGSSRGGAGPAGQNEGFGGADLYRAPGVRRGPGCLGAAAPASPRELFCKGLAGAGSQGALSSL